MTTLPGTSESRAERIGVVRKMVAACSLAQGSYARRRQDSYEHELRVLTARERVLVHCEQVAITEAPIFAPTNKTGPAQLATGRPQDRGDISDARIS